MMVTSFVALVEVCSSLDVTEEMTGKHCHSCSLGCYWLICNFRPIYCAAYLCPVDTDIPFFYYYFSALLDAA